MDEWSECLDINHWLPAYGYQQPTQLQQALLQQQDDLLANEVGVLAGGGAFLCLETIVEETSDDLDSERSTGWPDSDSDAASVIHRPHHLGEWSGSERDLAVPKKRRRRHDDDPEDLECASLSSRSSSLLQFECLEKQCEDVFRTSATADPFHAPNSPSNFSFDSLESSRWRFSASPDSLEESSDEEEEEEEDTSSDDTLQHSSWSSRGSSFRSSNSRLRSYRSFDSLNLLQAQQPPLLCELSQSLGSNTLLHPELSTDCKLLRAPGDLSLVETDCGDSQATIVDASTLEASPKGDAAKPQRSAENLSEDSGFGDHVRSCAVLPPLRDDEDASCCSDCSSDASASTSSSTSSEEQRLKLADSATRGWAAEDAKFSDSCWQSAPSLLSDAGRGAKEPTPAPEPVYDVPRRVHHLCESHQLCSVPENLDLCYVNAISNGCDDAAVVSAMTARLPAVSAPDLNNAAFLKKEQVFDSPFTSRLPLNDDDDDDDLFSEKPTSKSLTPLPGAAKGVHFCPVVSELSWRESFSEDDADDAKNENDMTDETWMTKDAKSFDDIDDIEWEMELRRAQKQKEEVLRKERLEVERLRQAALCRQKEEAPQQQRAASLPSVAVARPQGGAPPPAHVTAAQPQPPVARAMESGKQRGASEPPEAPKKKGFSGFFQRFNLRRLSGRRDAKKEKKDKGAAKKPPPLPAKGRSDDYEDVRIIPLHAEEAPVASKPPLPPRAGSSLRRRPDAERAPGGSSMTTIDRPGLLETDLDAVGGGKKARSLLDLGDGRLQPPPVAAAAAVTDARARSMEFLLDKDNQAAVQPPENELQKGGAGERVMSEHQLRVQRSLQKLNVPEWFKNSNVAGPGFLLRKNQQHQGWPGLGSKTTSLSSLGSTQSATPRSPTSQLLSPSPTPHVFTRWSTSRLNSGGTSTSTSPCGSTRSSFNYRQPYLGWRSQERLTRPRTPAERLAAGLQQQTGNNADQLLSPHSDIDHQPPHVPNLSEVRTSIKEVTSAIEHLVSGVRDGSGEALSQSRGSSEGLSRSPRGSGRLCWLESSFVGTRPLDSPETPLTAETKGTDLYLELNSSQTRNSHQVNGEYLLR